MTRRRQRRGNPRGLLAVSLRPRGAGAGPRRRELLLSLRSKQVQEREGDGQLKKRSQLTRRKTRKKTETSKLSLIHLYSLSNYSICNVNFWKGCMAIVICVNGCW